VGKSTSYYTAPIGAKRRPPVCLGCHGPVMYGDRCPPCEQDLRERVIKRKRRKSR
jgi:hypothetical protein